MPDEIPPPSLPPTHCTSCGRAFVRGMAAPAGMCLACWSKGGVLAAERLAAERLGAVAFGKFEILEGAGRGGMGTVYRARRVSDGLLVALKVMNAEQSGDAVFRERFRREAAALEMLDHPNVVQWLDHGEEDGVLFLAMEWMDGGNLQTKLRTESLSVGEAMGIFHQAAAGLAAVHDAGMVHRDIKPGNILLGPNGEVKLGDFGLMRRHDLDEGSLTLGTLQGATYYTAPELLHGGREADARSDIYSMGVLLYHLLTGKPPTRESPLVAKLGLKDCAPRVDNVISKAMKFDPKERYAGMPEMMTELEVGAGAGRKWRRRLLGSAALLTLGFAVWLGWKWRLEAAAPSMNAEDLRAMKLPGAVFIKPGRVAVPLLTPPSGGPPPIAMENSLGMKFRPIPRSATLLCIWETRIQDYKTHAEELVDGAPWIEESNFDFEGAEAMISLRNREWKKFGATWRKPGWEIADDQPVAGRCWIDAAAFCTWLTWVERKAGKIGADQAYRLPTDEEWSAAAGLPVEPGETPEERQESWPKSAHVWAWGTTWPPPPELVNLAGTELLDDGQLEKPWDLTGVRDVWPRVAPVEAVPVSALGFYHLSGNVDEWTDSHSGRFKGHYIMRGGNWATGTPKETSLTIRVADRPAVRHDWRGFRVAFQPSGAEGWRYGGAR